MNGKSKMIFLYIFTAIFFFYITVLTLVFFFQRNLLYEPGENNYLDQSELNHKIEEIRIVSDNELLGWYYEKNKNFKTLLFFHGNAGKLDNRIYKLNEISKLEVNYLIFAYRGFSGNKGKPSEKGLYKDARAAKYWLNLNNVPDDKIILYGESLGTAVAIDLGKDYNFAGVILESPFSSMVKLSRKYYPYLPTKILLKDRYESEKKITDLEFPILVMHGKNDNIVPFSMGLEIFEKANNPKFSYFNDDDHMMDFNKELLDKIKIFIKSLN